MDDEAGAAASTHLGTKSAAEEVVLSTRNNPSRMSTEEPMPKALPGGTTPRVKKPMRTPSWPCVESARVPFSGLGLLLQLTMVVDVQCC